MPTTWVPLLEGLSTGLNALLTALLVYAVLRGFPWRPSHENPCPAASDLIGERIGRTADLTPGTLSDTLGVGRAGTPAAGGGGGHGGENAFYRFLLTPEGDHATMSTGHGRNFGTEARKSLMKCEVCQDCLAAYLKEHFKRMAYYQRRLKARKHICLLGFGSSHSPEDFDRRTDTYEVEPTPERDLEDDAAERERQLPLLGPS